MFRASAETSSQAIGADEGPEARYAWVGTRLVDGAISVVLREGGIETIGDIKNTLIIEGEAQLLFFLRQQEFCLIFPVEWGVGCTSGLDLPKIVMPFLHQL